MPNASSRNPSAHHHLEADIRADALRLHVAFELTAPWTVFFGPSGSGKSTILRAICGLYPKSPITFATATAAGWNELDGNHHHTPPHLRNLAYAPQGAALFPHLTVHQNIAFPQSVRNQPAPAGHTNIDTLLDLFQLTALAQRYPRDLSGGERQRVALARAFAVPVPTLMLLDEPFTGIDRATRDQLLPAMQHHLTTRNIPTLSVTHDVEETLLLNAYVLRLESGHITTQGPAHQVLAAERISILHTLQRQA